MSQNRGRLAFAAIATAVLAAANGVPLDRIAKLQRDATETANVTLLPDGRLAD